MIPVRYQFSGSRSRETGEMSAKGKISWFLSLFSVSFGYEEKVFAQIRLFGLKWKPKEKRAAKEEQKFDSNLPPARSADLQTENAGDDTPQSGRSAALPSPNAGEDTDFRLSEEFLPEREEDSQSVPAGVFGRVKQIVFSVWEKGKKIPQGIRSVGEKVRNAFGCLRRGKEKAGRWLAFLRDEETKAALQMIWRQTRRAIRHILPGTVRIRGRFGFSDPALTGQVTGLISMMPVFYRKDISLVPVFSEACLDGEIFIRGRIRGASLLWILIRLLLHSDFRRMLRRFQKMTAEDE